MSSGEHHPNIYGACILEQLMNFIHDKISAYFQSSPVWIFFESKSAHIKTVFPDALQSGCLFAVCILKSLNAQLRDFREKESWWLSCSEKMIYDVILFVSPRKVDRDACNSHLICVGGGAQGPSPVPIILLWSGDKVGNWHDPLSLSDVVIHSLR